MKQCSGLGKSTDIVYPATISCWFTDYEVLGTCDAARGMAIAIAIAELLSPQHK